MYKRIVALFLTALMLCISFPFTASAVIAPENLVLNRAYTVETGEPISKTYGELTIGGIEYNKDNGFLTDGLTSGNERDSERWFRAYSGQSRIISFDLEKNHRIESVEMGLFQDPANNVNLPRYIKIHLSDDGENYQCIKEYEGKYNHLSDGKTERYWLKIQLDNPYSARYVRVEYSCYDFTYCDEIRVIGSQFLQNNERYPVANLQENNGGYLQSLSGYHDVVKLYNGFHPDASLGILTAYELLPYVAYLNKNEEVTDKMFDGAILLPCDATYLSGGKLYKTDDGFSLMSDFKLYIDQTFTAGQDLAALNKVVKEVNEKLESTDKFGVFLSIPYPCISDVPFGDLDDDGIEEYSKTLDERFAIVQWYIDKCVYMFASSGYDNLEICGFYWLEDSIDYNYSDHEEQLLVKVCNYLKSLDLEAVAGFGYLSAGFDAHEDLGFDSAIMKSEMITNGFSSEMLPEYSRSVYNNRLGVEIETGETAEYLADGNGYLKLGHSYESYMYYGKKYGYSAGLNVYEQDMGPGSIYEFCYADKSTPKGNYLRRLYELTYGYIKNNYNNLPPTISSETVVEMVYGDNQITLDLEINDIDSYAEDIIVEFPTRPQHGKVVASAGKNKLIYSVDNDFVGVDSFEVCVSDGFNHSEVVTVSVSVTKPESEDESKALDVSASPLPLGGKTDMPPWLIVLLIGLALAMLAVAITVALKPKTNK